MCTHTDKVRSKNSGFILLDKSNHTKCPQQPGLISKYFVLGTISTVKKQKDVTHKTQIFQEAQKTKTLNKKQIHMEPRDEFQNIPKIV